MPFLINKKNAQELYDNSVRDIIALTDLKDVTQHSALDGIVRAFSNRLAQFYSDMEINFNAGYITTASGPYLDALAKDRGLSRRVDTFTSISCESQSIRIVTKDGSTIYSTLGINPSVKYITIPKGHIITSSSNGNLLFTVDKSVTVLPANTSIDLGASAELPDNFIVAPYVLDTFDYIASPIFSGANLSNLSLEQPKAITGIRRVETDESLRLRITQHLQTFATSNTSSIYNSIINHPEVATVSISKNIRGTGSFDIIVYPVKNRISEAAMKEFRDRLLSTISFGEDGKIVEPDYIPLSVSVSLINKVDVSKITPAIEDFVRGLTNRSISYSILKNYLRNRGIEVDILRISVSYKNILPTSVITLFNTEIFELKPLYHTTSSVEIV